MLRHAVLCMAVVLGVAAPGCGRQMIRDTNFDDAAITARVKTVLLNDPQVGALKIDVTTAGGVVTMSGAVKSKDERPR